ncbi:hypothetical protein PMAYCL1PPCAC_25148, partial [Pristionchus mayeri]
FFSLSFFRKAQLLFLSDMGTRPLHERLVEESLERNKARAAALNTGRQRPMTRLQTRLAASASDEYAGSGGFLPEDSVDIADFGNEQYMDTGIDDNGVMYHVYEIPPDASDDSFNFSDGFQYHQEADEDDTSSSGVIDVESFDDRSADSQGVELAEHDYESASYLQLQAAWRQQAAWEAQAAKEAEERIPEEYNEYMMERLELEQHTEETAAVRAVEEAKKAEEARKQRLRDERARLAKERNAELMRREQELHESRTLEKRQARLKHEEAALASEVKNREKQLRKRTEQQSIERLAQLAHEQDVEAKIARLAGEMEEQKERLRVMRAEREAQERDLEQQEVDLEEARFKAAAKKEERIKATKEYDDHPISVAARYSRQCTICLTANPRRRATLIACGHMMCATCAEQMSEGPGSSAGQFACPYCRKTTGFVQTFEDPEEIQEVIRPMTPEVSTTTPRKRKADDIIMSSPQGKLPRPPLYKILYRT